MRNTEIGPGLVFLACLFGMVGCNGRIDDLGGDPDAGSSSGSPMDSSVGSALPEGVLATDSVVGLSDTQANAVCTWLAAKFDVVWPGAAPAPDASAPPSAPGYAQGPSVGCTSVRLGWVLLDQTNCVANLRYSPCPATIGDLAQCLDSISGSALSEPGVSCGSGCTAYESSPLCDQTVIQSVYTGLGPTLVTCGGLPIVTDAVCPNPPEDAGAD